MAAQTTPPASPAARSHETSHPPIANDPRFLIELEFVLALSNPSYLSNLAMTHPHLLIRKPDVSRTRRRADSLDPAEDTEADRFARYLAYLYSYWRTPEYSRYLTHPGQTLRALELLQHEHFRRDIIKPAVIEALARGEDLAVAEHEKTEEDEAMSNKDANGTGIAENGASAASAIG